MAKRKKKRTEHITKYKRKFGKLEASLIRVRCAHNIRALRLSHGMIIEELADICGIKYGQLIQTERASNMASPELIKGICAHFNITEETLLFSKANLEIKWE